MSTSDERLTKLEVSVGVLDTKMDETGKKLSSISFMIVPPGKAINACVGIRESPSGFYL